MIPTRFLIGGLIIVAAIAFMTFRSFQANATYYVTSDEMVQKVQAGQITPGKTVRLAGNIDKSSVQWDASKLDLRFNASNKDVNVPVRFTGPLPDSFHMADSVVVEGTYNADGSVTANNLFVQCPSKYEAEIKQSN